MTKKLDSAEKLESVLQSTLEFSSKKEKLNFEAAMLHLDTMHMVERLMKANDMSEKDLAKKLNISKKKLVKLFTGDKLLNYKILAKFQRIFDVNFVIGLKLKA